MSATTRDYTRRSTKAVRRSSDNWVDGHPQLGGVRRFQAPQQKPDIVRFPQSKATPRRRTTQPAAVIERLSSVQATWSDREREQRRIAAIRKQQELLMLLADAELEDGVRLAVADGEQPILPPEIEVLRN